ncbi:MAG: ATP-binding protein [Syntrophaceae bacterium]|nr:ATP-binding protein [Syntrophaceae bacterium]
MNESMSTMNTNQSATAQAGKLVSMAKYCEQKSSEPSFSDNLDYLQAMEQEGRLILAYALLRQHGPDWQGNSNYVQAMSMAGLSPLESKPEIVADLISLIEQKNRKGAEMAEQKGIMIYFTKFCREKKVEEFNRTLVLLLLLLSTNERFAKMFDLCAFGDDARKGSAVKIATIINVICSEYREQLVSRKNFSTESPLIRQEILQIDFCDDDKTTIFEKYVSLNDRYVRYMVGDNNLYKNTSRMIQRDEGSVHLDQVIVPDQIKTELVSRIGNYLACRESKEAKMLDDFYGYGTALTLLFHGPSGTGKTMMAQALANHFNKPLYSLKSNKSECDGIIIVDDSIKKLFLEASLNSGIVYFDEADDFFIKNSWLSRLLLIEIEKARCVVILSTNQPVNLDPAMDRRLSLKVCFGIPDAELRYRIWQALMPDFVKLAPDVDLKLLAERYNFTGGLIKNSIFMALVSSLTSASRDKSLITMDMIDKAAQLQLHQMADTNSLYQVYAPASKGSDLPINNEQRIQLGNAVNVYKNLREKKSGLNILITASDIETGIAAVELMAGECNLKIRKFDYTDLYEKNTVDYGMVFDPISQTKKYPIELAFGESTGDAFLLMFVDCNRIATWTDDSRERDISLERMFLSFDLRHHMRYYKGLFCMVTFPPLGKIPKEFHLHFNIECPNEEMQMMQWRKHLDKYRISDNDLVSLVKNHPMHIVEIDYFVQQAEIQSVIEGNYGELTARDINNVIDRYCSKRPKPVLFGQSDNANHV